ncbi:unnamed protein product [Staurois parvus]|uniref:Uncharacterized protein n=1 Tax=Staurois parvus TaxID=386267 RepID=A0ABN9EZN5_9NEOB|nr:unnamed protein product [Staurois parvus]
MGPPTDPVPEFLNGQSAALIVSSHKQGPPNPLVCNCATSLYFVKFIVGTL